MILTSVLLVLPFVLSLAPLEFPEQGKLYYGPWYDRLHGDTISSVIKRVNYKPFSFFQSDFNLTTDCQPHHVNQFFQQLDESGTDAIAYVTLYPILGFDQVTDNSIIQISNILAFQIAKGGRVFLRYGSEMNGINQIS